MFEVTLSQALGVSGKKESDFLASTKLNRVWLQALFHTHARTNTRAHTYVRTYVHTYTNKHTHF